MKRLSAFVLGIVALVLLATGQPNLAQGVPMVPAKKAGDKAEEAEKPKDIVLKGKVVDEEGNGVIGADICRSVTMTDGVESLVASTKSGEEGAFELAFRVGSYDHYRISRGMTLGLFARDAAMRHGCIAMVDQESAKEPLTLSLTPLATVRGQTLCSAWDTKLKSGSVGVTAHRTNPDGKTHSDRVIFVGSRQESHFEFQLPKGSYTFGARFGLSYGAPKKADGEPVLFEVDASGSAVDLGDLDVPLSKIGEHVGKPLPEFEGTDVIQGGESSLAEGFKLSDWKGKWVLIEFWGFW